MRAGLRDGEAEERILHLRGNERAALPVGQPVDRADVGALVQPEADDIRRVPFGLGAQRSEEHTSELQSLMRISYAVFCLTKKNSYRHPPLTLTPSTHHQA